MPELQETGVRLVAEGQNDFERALGGAENALSSFESAGSRVSGGMGAFSEIVTGGLRRIGETAVNVLGAATSAVGDLFGSMVSGNAEFERYETQFGVMLGSAEAAKERIAELAVVGATTPFELPELVRADKIMQAFGLHAENVAERFGFAGDEIRIIAGDVAAGTGAGFEEIAGYIGKFASGATGEAISRMQELGIVTRQELAEMGLEFSKSGELLTPIDDAMDVVLGAMQSKFGGMMEAQSGTFEGMMSNFEDFKAGAIRTIGAPIFDAAKGGLGKLLEFLNGPAVQQGLKDTTAFLADVAGAASAFIEVLLEGDVGGAFDALGEFDSVRAILQGLGIDIYGVGTAVQGAVDFIATNLPLVQETFGVVFDNVSKVFGAVIGLVTETLLPAIASIWESTGAELPTAQETFENVMNGIVVATTLATDFITNVLVPIIETAVAFIVENWPKIQAVIETVMQAVDVVIRSVLAGVQTFWQTWGDDILGIVDWFVGQYNLIFQTFSRAFEGDWRGFGETLREIWDNAWTMIKDAAANTIEAIAEIDWEKVGTGILDGIADGVRLGAGALIEAVMAAARAALEAAKGFLGISSPSRRAGDEIGDPFVQGIITRIEAAIPEVSATVKMLADELVAPPSGATYMNQQSQVTTSQVTNNWQYRPAYYGNAPSASSDLSLLKVWAS